MLKNGRRRNKKWKWALRYKIEEPLQEIVWPHVVVIHGEHVLTTRVTTGCGRWVSLHAHRLSEARSERTPPSIGLYADCHSLRTFAYVETTEPLALYGCDGGDIGDDEEWRWIRMFDVDDMESRWRLERRMIASYTSILCCYR